ncbi:MAG: transglycosylase SLT domain-containing protein, partial [Bryobacterales bacterium]|nr:transglycosylase SLT domain-containing protein [Bryobacterales bacterium]
MPGIRSSWLPAVVALAASASEPRAAEQALARSVARQQESIRAMEQAIAQQLAAVRRQRESALGPAASLEPDRVAPQGCGPLAKPDISPLVQQAARRERLEEALLWAVIERESGFDPCAVSSRGALGLMQ